MDEKGFLVDMGRQGLILSLLGRHFAFDRFCILGYL